VVAVYHFASSLRPQYPKFTQSSCGHRRFSYFLFTICPNGGHFFLLPLRTSLPFFTLFDPLLLALSFSTFSLVSPFVFYPFFLLVPSPPIFSALGSAPPHVFLLNFSFCPSFSFYPVWTPLLFLLYFFFFTSKLTGCHTSCPSSLLLLLPPFFLASPLVSSSLLPPRPCLCLFFRPLRFFQLRLVFFSCY